MTPQLYSELEPRDTPVDETRCEWAVPSWPREHHNSTHQCSFKIQERIAGHGYCHRHAKMVQP